MRKVRLNEYIECKKYYEIILTNRNNKEVGKAIIDKEDILKVKVCRWGLNGTTKTTQGYVNSCMTTMHQFLLGKKDGYLIDHKNRNPLDNRRKNLRYATKSQNGVNTLKRSGVCLVKPQKESPKWKKRWKMQVQKTTNGAMKKYYSYHYTKKEAIEAKKIKTIELFGDFAPY